MGYYTYDCENCGDIEVIMSYTELDNFKKCPECGSEKIERVYKPINSIWKCGGAYGKGK